MRTMTISLIVTAILFLPTHVLAGGALEQNIEAFIQALGAKGGPPIYELSIEEARKVLDSAQSGSVKKLPAQIEDRTIPGGPTGKISIRIVRPKKSSGKLPVVMYFHGGGWILGNKDTIVSSVRLQTARGLRSCS